MKRIDQRIEALEEFLKPVIPLGVDHDPGPYEAAGDELEELYAMRARGEDLPEPPAPTPAITVYTVHLVLAEMAAQNDNHKFGRCLYVLWDADADAVALYYKALTIAATEDNHELRNFTSKMQDWLGNDLMRLLDDIRREGIPRKYAHGLRRVQENDEGPLGEAAAKLAFQAETGEES